MAYKLQAVANKAKGELDEKMIAAETEKLEKNSKKYSLIMKNITKKCDAQLKVCKDAKHKKALNNLKKSALISTKKVDAQAKLASLALKKIKKAS
ncbi:hypothetical protein [Sulfitobacter sediminilitoris]